MSTVSLERFDSPIIIISQAYEGADWGVMASYVSKQDTEEVEGKASPTEIGWYVSVILPDLNDAEFDQAFSTPEDALEFGVNQIVSGKLKPATPPVNRLKDESSPFGHYDSIA